MLLPYMVQSLNKILTNFFFPVLTVIIGTFIVKEYMTDSVDLSYILSASIPTKLVDSAAVESVQQLTIINRGNQVAKEIQIKINSPIINYRIQKHSVDDKTKEHVGKRGFEATYSKLPPQSQLVYILTVNETGITANNIDISHASGKGNDALTSASSSFAFNLIYYTFIIFMIFVFVRDIIKGQKETELGYFQYKDFTELLVTKRPFYISRKDWQFARNKYIKEQKEVSNSYIDIEDDISYKILNNCKPEYLTNMEWQQTIDVLTIRFIELFKQKVKQSYKIQELEVLLLIVKPLEFAENKWLDLSELIQKEFYTISKVSYWDSLSATGPKELLRQINRGRPKGMDDEIWLEYSDCLKATYLIYIMFDITQQLSRDVIDADNLNLSILRKEAQEQISNFICHINWSRLPNMLSLGKAKAFIENISPPGLSNNDRDSLQATAESYIKLEQDVVAYNLLLNCLERIINRCPIGEQPDEIEGEEWGKLKTLEKDIVVLAEKNVDEQKRLLQLTDETNELKTKVLNQLKLINHTLENPRAPSLIEEYENPFSEGNLENLKQVAEILKLKDTELHRS